MNRRIQAVIVAIGLCAMPALAQNSRNMVEEAKYKAAAEVEQIEKAQVHRTVPEYQNVKIHQTVEEKRATSEPRCGSCSSTVIPE